MQVLFIKILSLKKQKNVYTLQYTIKTGENSMKRKILQWCIIAVFLFSVSVVAVCEHIHEDISGGLVRLHIIANSDSEKDQRVKLMVRDAIIECEKDIFKEGIKKTLNNEEKGKIKKTAEKILYAQGARYGARVETGDFYFPTKQYENITLPAGKYDAVRVVLGEGQGKNWWCVMYPPLCFGKSYTGVMQDESLNILKEKMSDFDYEIISEENIKTVPAFKVVELWQIVKEKIRNSL